jgi:hypothetical protein
MISGPRPCPICRPRARTLPLAAYPLAISVGIFLDGPNRFFSKSHARVGLGADFRRFSVIFLFA